MATLMMSTEQFPKLRVDLREAPMYERQSSKFIPDKRHRMEQPPTPNKHGCAERSVTASLQTTMQNSIQTTVPSIPKSSSFDKNIAQHIQSNIPDDKSQFNKAKTSSERSGATYLPGYCGPTGQRLMGTSNLSHPHGSIPPHLIHSNNIPRMIWPNSMVYGQSGSVLTVGMQPPRVESQFFRPHTGSQFVSGEVPQGNIFPSNSTLQLPTTSGQWIPHPYSTTNAAQMPVTWQCATEADPMKKTNTSVRASVPVSSHFNPLALSTIDGNMASAQAVQSPMKIAINDPNSMYQRHPNGIVGYMPQFRPGTTPGLPMMTPTQFAYPMQIPPTQSIQPSFTAQQPSAFLSASQYPTRPLVVQQTTAGHTSGPPHKSAAANTAAGQGSLTDLIHSDRIPSIGRCNTNETNTPNSRIGQRKHRFTTEQRRGLDVCMLQRWMFPYFDSGEMNRLAKSLGLDKQQVHDWLRTHRSRYWAPIMRQESPHIAELAATGSTLGHSFDDMLVIFKYVFRDFEEGHEVIQSTAHLMSHNNLISEDELVRQPGEKQAIEHLQQWLQKVHDRQPLRDAAIRARKLQIASVLRKCDSIGAQTPGQHDGSTNHDDTASEPGEPTSVAEFNAACVLAGVSESTMSHEENTCSTMSGTSCKSFEISHKSTSDTQHSNSGVDHLSSMSISNASSSCVENRFSSNDHRSNAITFLQTHNVPFPQLCPYQLFEAFTCGKPGRNFAGSKRRRTRAY